MVWPVSLTNGKRPKVQQQPDDLQLPGQKEIGEFLD